LVYRKTARNFAPVMAMAATTTIAAVRRVCELGELDPETVVTPGIFVKRVVLRDGAPPAAEPAVRVPAVVPAGVAINTWG
ncbi:CoA-transferase, partial [Escherichia coli]|uniref:CoA-transferase n=2 Tax=Pseudomonadota TaxID=1224 RepID=UPI003BA14CD7